RTCHETFTSSFDRDKISCLRGRIPGGTRRVASPAAIASFKKSAYSEIFVFRCNTFTPMEIQMTVGPSTQCYAGLELTTIDHVQLAIPPGSEDDCRRFYVNVLGLAEKPKPPVLAARGGLWLMAGAVEIHLGVERDFRPAKKAHPAFRVR